MGTFHKRKYVQLLFMILIVTFHQQTTVTNPFSEKSITVIKVFQKTDSFLKKKKKPDSMQPFIGDFSFIT